MHHGLKHNKVAFEPNRVIQQVKKLFYSSENTGRLRCLGGICYSRLYYCSIEMSSQPLHSYKTYVNSKALND